ncbi:MAG: hypothetical protein JO108_36140, partial [Acidobacteriaceae bacterium]|nr:hypothetical protein [Acidobacteriaceae bacterium]
MSAQGHAPLTPEWRQACKEERIRRKTGFQDKELMGFTLTPLLRIRKNTILSAKEKTLRKMMVLAVMVALAALMLAAAPAMASPQHDNSKGAHKGNWDRWDNNHGNWDPWNNN